MATDGLNALGDVLAVNRQLRLLNLSGNLANDKNLDRLVLSLKVRTINNFTVDFLYMESFYHLSSLVPAAMQPTSAVYIVYILA